jgi:hypothetical protein
VKTGHYNYDYWLKNAWEMLERSPKISQEDKERASNTLFWYLSMISHMKWEDNGRESEIHIR